MICSLLCWFVVFCYIRTPKPSQTHLTPINLYPLHKPVELHNVSNMLTVQETLKPPVPVKQTNSRCSPYIKQTQSDSVCHVNSLHLTKSWQMKASDELWPLIQKRQKQARRISISEQHRGYPGTGLFCVFWFGTRSRSRTLMDQLVPASPWPSRLTVE